MRRIVLHMMMSLDGLVASADKSESWMVAPDHERDAVSAELAQHVDVALIGHGVYHDMAGYWPTAEGQTETQRALIDRVNSMPKLVVAHEESALDWNATTLVVPDGDLANRLGELKRSLGGDIVAWGGAHLARELAALDVIDEYRLIIQPVTLGSGSGLFTGTGWWRRFRLREARPFRTGAVFLRYERDGGDRTT